MITDDEARKMHVCAPLLGEPGSEVVRSMVDELLAARRELLAARNAVRAARGLLKCCKAPEICGAVLDAERAFADYDMAGGK